uniref:Ribonuclease Z n=1 Tax=Balbiania investiens TaxID=111861 RepID=A0A4D6BMV1_9FLOR|nr:ribonuclease Z [Balbiania investiens]QBX88538.1 ribonuclease Z [Balbiania investiens]
MLRQSLSFLLKCSQTGIVWLFNCPEGCQHIIMHRQIKLNQITHIVITNLAMENLAGLIGLLSSLSLSSRLQNLVIYGPKGLWHYLQFLRKYSQTTFRYSLKIYIIEEGLLNCHPSYSIYANPVDMTLTDFEYIIIENEKIGRFKLLKANIFQINPGPIYGKLKQQHHLMLPDGCIVSGQYFTDPYCLGLKIIYLINIYGIRPSIEDTLISNRIIQK